MSKDIEILVIIAICFVIVLVVTAAAILLAKKKISAAGLIEKVDKGIGYAQAIAAALKPFLPSVADGVIDVILKYAAQAVQHVEGTYKAALSTGTTAADTRSSEATALIKAALSLEGINDTEQIDKLIAAVIPVLVLALPKTHTESTTATVAAK